MFLHSFANILWKYFNQSNSHYHQYVISNGIAFGCDHQSCNWAIFFMNSSSSVWKELIMQTNRIFKYLIMKCMRCKLFKNKILSCVVCYSFCHEWGVVMMRFLSRTAYRKQLEHEGIVGEIRDVVYGIRLCTIISFVHVLFYRRFHKPKPDGSVQKQTQAFEIGWTFPVTNMTERNNS